MEEGEVEHDDGVGGAEPDGQHVVRAEVAVGDPPGRHR
jgi:hypothetical protein